MPDMLEDGASLVADMLSAHVSQTVTYRRGSLSNTTLKATKAPVRTESAVELPIDLTLQDWIIKVSLLTLGGAEITPEKNDVIEESNGQKWQVLPLGGEPEARYSDPFGKSWRIHTKRIKEPD